MATDFNQDSVLRFLLGRGGSARNAELLTHFTRFLREEEDERARARNRELFKRYVNGVATVVKRDGGVSYVVLKRRYQQRLGDAAKPSSRGRGEESAPRRGEAPTQRKPLRNAAPDTPGVLPAAGIVNDNNNDVEAVNLERSVRRPSPPARARDAPRFRAGAISLAFSHPSRTVPDFRLQSVFGRHPRRRLQLAALQAGRSEPEQRQLPHAESSDQPCAPEALGHDSMSFSSRHSQVPLEPREHEWFVKAASGNWSDIYALFREDHNLLNKRDIISGYTVLHWIAKHGDHRVLNTLSYGVSKAGMTLDVDAKSACGYTPLHLAAIHSHKSFLRVLVHKFKANVALRDSSGKKPWQYLEKCDDWDLLELLGAPRRTSGGGAGGQWSAEKPPVLSSAPSAATVKRHSSLAALFKHKSHLRISANSETFL
uniref:SOWAHA-C winged helix-turn-helix domain-containing protein n=1 Tax=Pygocentrus nattereri TaxID=42514 RepID=A0AAR2JR11_PYGNA